jgi:hypothetical protein
LRQLKAQTPNQPSCFALKAMMFVNYNLVGR